MKKTGFLTLLLAAVLVGTVGCTSSGKKKKKSGSGSVTSKSGSQPSEDKVWKYGFSGCVSIGGSTGATAGSEDPLDPATESSGLFVVLEDTKDFRIPGQPGDHHIDITYDFSVNGASADSYIEAKVQNKGKTVVFFTNWPAKGSEQSTWPKVKVVANGTIDGEKQTREYTLVMNPFEREYIKFSLDDIYKTGTECLDWMSSSFVPSGAEGPVAGAYGPDMSKYPTAWTKSEKTGQIFANIETYGKLTSYCAADGNSAVLQCGDQAIQLYQLKEYGAWAASKEAFLNQDVIVRGCLSAGYGNIQLSYIDSIFPLTSSYGKTVDPIPAPGEITEAVVTNKQWWSQPSFNKEFKATDVVFNGNVYQITNVPGGKPTTGWKGDTSSDGEKPITGSALQSIDFAAKRYEFEVKVGSTVVTVQTDYHMITDYPDLAAGLKELVNKPVGTTVKLGGALHWLNDRTVQAGNDYSTRSAGAWEIFPYLPSHVA